jgi:serine/threonine protein kinase
VAPEQALNGHDTDIRADIYSLGATFYFCLTGKPPFPTGTFPQKLIWHLTRQPKPVRQLRPEVSEGLAGLIDRMMAKDPAQRLQTPQEVADALAPYTAEPIGPPPEDEMPRLCPAALSVARDRVVREP